MINKILKIIFDIFINGTLLFFFINAFLNIDVLKISQIILLSILVINGYIINKKILRENKCRISWKQVLTAFGIGLTNMLFLIFAKKIF